MNFGGDRTPYKRTRTHITLLRYVTLNSCLLETQQNTIFYIFIPRWGGGGWGGILPGILGWGVPRRSSNPDPVSDQKMKFSTLVFRLDL